MSLASTRSAAALYLTVLVCLGAVVVPFMPSSFAEQKLPFAAAALSVALLLCALALFTGERPRSAPSTFLFGSLLPIVALLSAAFSGESFALSLWGEGGVSGSIMSATLFGAALVATSFVSDSAARTLAARMPLILAALVGFVLLAYAVIPGHQLLAETWTTLALFAAAGLFSGVLYVDTARTPHLRVLGLAVLSLLVAEFVLVFHVEAAFLLIAACVLLLLWRALSGALRPFPFAALFTVIVIAALLFLGMRAPLVRSVGEVRPSFALSALVLAPSYLESMRTTLFGAGPNNFGSVWQKYKPQEVNTSSYWDLAPAHGYSTVMTLAATLGILGVLALLFPLLYALVPARERILRSGATRLTMPLAVFCTALLALYPAGESFFLFSAVILGLSLRSRAPDTTPHDGTTRTEAYAAGVACALAGLALMFAAILYVTSLDLRARAYAVQEVSRDDFLAALRASADLWPSAQSYMDLADAYLARAREHAEAGEELSATADIARATDFADRIARMDRFNPDAHLRRAIVYLSLDPSYENASLFIRESLDSAEKLSSVDPRIHYARAVFYYNGGDRAGARAEVRRALELKPDFEEAKRLLDLLD